MDIQEKLPWLYYSIKGLQYSPSRSLQGTSGKFKMTLKQIESSKDLESVILKHARSYLALYKVGQ
jgi:hypothetical protein